ncbi:MAG: hypothetical protein HLUCCA24_00060, partial [Rhodobacteraceae bacterium HLUCCA24]
MHVTTQAQVAAPTTNPSPSARAAGEGFLDVFDAAAISFAAPSGKGATQDPDTGRAESDGEASSDKDGAPVVPDAPSDRRGAADPMHAFAAGMAVIRGPETRVAEAEPDPTSAASEGSAPSRAMLVRRDSASGPAPLHVPPAANAVDAAVSIDTPDCVGAGGAERLAEAELHGVGERVHHVAA